MTRTVLRTAAAHPDRPAIVGDDGALDYHGLLEDSRRVFATVDATHRAQQHPPASPAAGIPITAISVDSAFHAARIVAGLAGYRAVSAVLDPRWPLEHRVGIVLAAGIGLVIADDPAVGDALAGAGFTGAVLTLDAFRTLEAATAPADPPTVRPDDEPFLLLFSSGTTNRPKAFLKTRRQYRANVAISAAHLEPDPGVATFAPGPLSYSLTLYALIECLATGGSAHLADRFDAFALARRVRDEQIGRIVAVPATIHALADAAMRDPASFATLRLVVTGGANLPASLRTALAEALPTVRLIGYYGAAEIGFIGDSRDGDGTLLDIYDGVRVAIRDDDDRPAPDGELGTLWVHADACSDGYISATTGAALRDAAGWATVHDQARLLGGRLQLVGRAGDIVVTGGHKVALGEVERVFDGMPRLGDACAIGLAHPRLGHVVALVLEGDGPGRRELQEWATARLAPQAIPRRWYRLDTLPRTVGGKIRRDEVAASISAGAGVRL